MDARLNGSAPRGQASIPVPPPVPIPKRPLRAWPWAVGAFLLAAALLTGLVVAFADGRALLVPPAHVDGLRWNP